DEIRVTPRTDLLPYTTLFRSEGPDRAGNADEKRGDGKGGELCRQRADSDDLGSDVHVADSHPGAAEGAAHQVLGDQRQQCCEARSEEHTSELQSRENLVCRLL